MFYLFIYLTSPTKFYVSKIIINYIKLSKQSWRNDNGERTVYNHETKKTCHKLFQPNNPE